MEFPDREREPTDDELREEDVTAGDRLDDRVAEGDEQREAEINRALSEALEADDDR